MDRQHPIILSESEGDNYSSDELTSSFSESVLDPSQYEDIFDPFLSLTPVPPVTEGAVTTQPIIQTSNSAIAAIPARMTALTLNEDENERSLHSTSSSSGESGFSDYEINASDLERGKKDWQGIPWNCSNISRAQFRTIRTREYFNLESTNHPQGAHFPQESSLSNHQFYRFEWMDRFESVSIHHYQLRHLMVSDSEDGIFYPKGNRIKQWNGKTRQATTRLNLSTLARAFSRVVSLDYYYLWDLIVAGGISGELVLHRSPNESDLTKKEKIFAEGEYFSIAPSDTGIVTNLQITPFDFSIHATCNDNALRLFDCKRGSVSKIIKTETPCNSSNFNLENRLIGLATDSPGIFLVDPLLGKVVTELEGHNDGNFAVNWISENLLASGGQDHALLIHDIRSPNKPLISVPTQMACIRQLISKNNFLAVMEADDYCHIYDTLKLCANSNDENCFGDQQLIDFFGEAAGIAFSDDGSNFHIGITGNEFGGIMRLKRVPLGPIIP
jgi:hypothetical protein